MKKIINIVVFFTFGVSYSLSQYKKKKKIVWKESQECRNLSETIPNVTISILNKKNLSDN
jgi:uncharacterized membrane protein